MLDHHGIERAAVAGASMGAHTRLAFALAHPERVLRPGADHARLRRQRPRGRVRAAGTRSPTGSSAAAWRAFMDAWHPTVRPERWLEHAPPLVTRQRLSGTSTPRRWRTRCASCRARARSSRSTSSSRSELPVLVVAPPRRVGSHAPARGGAGVRAQAPRRRAGGGGGGQVAARLAGRAALERDRRLPGPLLVEHAAEPHDRRALLDRHLVVLARAHREALEAVLGGQLGEPREVAAVVLRAGSRTGGMHIRPVTGTGTGLDVVGQVRRGRCPPCSPRRPRSPRLASRGPASARGAGAPSRRPRSGSGARSGPRP